MFAVFPSLHTSAQFFNSLISWYIITL
uniref:Uncharacterized protein n=1 Tax=Anguilla anguilla TaxID=7936 RepID=A0A0E9WDI8_ANGAN